MAVDGEWQLMLDSPMGRSAPKLILKVDGASISGTWKGQMATADFSGGEIDGDRIVISLELPVSGQVSLVATIEGDTLSGEMEGPRGKVPVTGTRVR